MAKNWSATRYEHIDEESGAMLSVSWVDDRWRWKVAGVGMFAAGSGTATTSGAAKADAIKALATHMKRAAEKAQ